MTTVPLPIGFRGAAIDVSTQAGRAFLQERVAMFARAMLGVMLVQGTAMGMTRVLTQTGQRIRPGSFLVIGLALVFMGGLWRSAARGRWSPKVARWADVACVTDPAALLAGTVYLNRDLRVGPYMGIVFVGFLVFGRALIIPSSGQRTVGVSLACFAPLVAVQAYLAWRMPATQVVAPAIQTAAVATSAVIASGLAGYGSSIVSGLRERAKTAERLGQYTLKEKIGEGGMGIVYRAQHAMLRRPTAVKLLPAEKTGDLAARRFEREVQLTSELHHPNTVHIYDFGRSEEGVFYYAMELLDGIDLAELVERDGPQPAGRVARILTQICGSLHEAHRHGLVHRDIKPANVFLCHLAEMPDVVKVLDFGLVKEVEPAGGRHLTEADVVAGTPGYLAPETITDPDRVGPPVDLYALGALGYFLVTGEDVFVGKTAVEVCSHHLHSCPVPPSKRLGMAIDEKLEVVILRLLEKNPSDRFEDARTVAEALMASEAYPTWTTADADRWWTEGRWTERRSVPRRRPHPSTRPSR